MKIEQNHAGKIVLGLGLFSNLSHRPDYFIKIVRIKRPIRP